MDGKIYREMDEKIDRKMIKIDRKMIKHRQRNGQKDEQIERRIDKWMGRYMQK